jgi:hypothetical protein
MVHLRDIKKNPYSILGGGTALFTLSLIIGLFLVNSVIGSLGSLTEYLLYYIIPVLLIISIILLSIEKIKSHSGRRRSEHQRVKRIRKAHSH